SLCQTHRGQSFGPHAEHTAERKHFMGIHCSIRQLTPRKAGQNPAVTLQREQHDNEILQMFWYRLSVAGGLRLVTYSFGKDVSSNEAPFNQSKFAMSRPTLTRSSLQINSVEAADSAVYSCASRRAHLTLQHHRADRLR
uniref:Ig-like domain-containing protein n=1 Tax=Mola mola TaxID=94237 RepID=A0A3Q3XF94_MOLML